MEGRRSNRSTAMMTTRVGPAPTEEVPMLIILTMLRVATGMLLLLMMTTRVMMMMMMMVMMVVMMVVIMRGSRQHQISAGSQS